MSHINIIVAFPKIETARSIRGILLRNGYSSIHLCNSGAQVLSAAQRLDYGVVIVSIRLADMIYSEISDDLPEGFQMIVVAKQSSWESFGRADILQLSLPLTVHDLISATRHVADIVEQIKKKNRNKPRKRSVEEQLQINQAKMLLIERNNMTESDAHRYLQKTSMENGCSMAETAQMLLSMMDHLD